MAGTAVNKSARTVVYHTADITDGDMTAATTLGPLAEDGSATDPPETLTDSLMTGDAAAGATLSHTYRIAGDSTNLATLVSAMNAAAPTEVYFFLVSHSATSYTSVGPVIINDAQAVGNTVGARRGGIVVSVSGKGDAPVDLYRPLDVAVTNL